jgi:hypothetical protein
MRIFPIGFTKILTSLIYLMSYSLTNPYLKRLFKQLKNILFILFPTLLLINWCGRKKNLICQNVTNFVKNNSSLKKNCFIYCTMMNQVLPKTLWIIFQQIWQIFWSFFHSFNHLLNLFLTILVFNFQNKPKWNRLSNNFKKFFFIDRMFWLESSITFHVWAFLLFAVRTFFHCFK